MCMKEFQSKALEQNQHQLKESIESGISIDEAPNTSKSFVKEKPKRKEKPLIMKDKVERYLSLKAYANPHYLIAEFQHSLKTSSSDGSEVCQEDPIRKSLAIGSYAKALSETSTLYSQEFQDIGKVSFKRKCNFNKLNNNDI